MAYARENGLPRRGANCAQRPVLAHGTPEASAGGGAVATCMPKLRTPIEGWLEREIAVTTYLAEQGAPVVGPSRELPPGPHERGGFPISFWTYVEPDPDRTPTTDDCSAMLVDLHPP